MRKVVKGVLVSIAAIGAAYLSGPTVQFDPVQGWPVEVPSALPELEDSLAKAEKAVRLKPDNEARIVWADSSRKTKTPYSIVYIPGFGASWAEGDPIHRNVARRFGCNLFLARTAEHGLQSPDALKHLTPARYAASAERALAVGKALGERVIVMGTSAGGMLTLYLAEHHPELEGLILYSPCIATANPGLRLTTKPWGKQLMDQIFSGEHVDITRYSAERANYWLTRYHTNGLLTLQAMMDEFMTPARFARIKQPLFMGYYYKDENHQDEVVSVPAMLAMYDALGTPAPKKRKVAFPEAGDHVIASRFTANDLAGVERETSRFIREVLKLTPAAATSGRLAPIPKK